MCLGVSLCPAASVSLFQFGRGCLSFALNDVDLGEAASGLFGQALQVAVDLYSKEDMISISHYGTNGSVFGQHGDKVAVKNGGVSLGHLANDSWNGAVVAGPAISSGQHTWLFRVENRGRRHFGIGVITAEYLEKYPELNRWIGQRSGIESW